MTEGAVGNLEAADGRREVSPFVLGDGEGDAMTGRVGRFQQELLGFYW